MGDFTGKKSKRKQTNAMNEMNEMVQLQVDEFKGKQEIAQDRADKTRGQYEDFDFKNPYAGAQNVYAGAQNAYAGLTNQFAGLENKYEGMENRFEDMTVDMRAADFQAQQGQQQRANIMQGLKGSAGSSGVAGLAQALANQGSMQSQQISAGIGQQERQNQMLAAQEGSRIDMTQRGAGMQLQQMQASGAQQLQGQQAAGAMATQQMQMGGAAQQQGMILEGAAAQQAAQAQQQATLLGMDYGALAGANAGYQGALSNQMSGMGMEADMYGAQSQNNMFSTIMETGAAVAGGIGAAGGMATFMSDRRLKKNINLISKSPSGLNIYSFEYINSKYGEGVFQGVMSGEIPQEAVIQMDNGYDAVNYNMLDVEFKQI
tara:strand:+ start:592 stop:1713 length:1122 start_codon:yes stop_codon:yes gene_type:complete